MINKIQALLTQSQIKNDSKDHGTQETINEKNTLSTAHPEYVKLPANPPINIFELPKELPKPSEFMPYWKIPQELYDELPDEEYNAQVDAEATVQTFLSISDNKITEVKAYIDQREITPISIADIDIKTKQQYFIHENMAYALGDNECKVIDEVLGDLGDPAIVTKTLERQNLKLHNYHKVMTDLLQKEEENILFVKDLSPKVVTKLILRTFSQLYTNRLQKQLQNNKEELKIEGFVFPLNKTSTTIGNLMIEMYAYKNLLHKGTQIEIKEVGKYKKVKEHLRITNEQINELLQGFKKVPAAEKTEAIIIMEAYIMLYAVEKKIIPEIESKEHAKLQFTLQKYAQTIGVTILSLLTKAQITEDINLNLSEERKNIPHIKIKIIHIEEAILAPLSYNKPKISKHPRSEFLTIGEENNMELKITTNSHSQIFFRENKNKIDPSADFDQVLISYNEIPHTINKNVLQDLLAIYKNIMSSTAPKLSNIHAKDFFKAVYFIDLDPIIVANQNSNENMSLLEDLINYSLLLNSRDFDNMQRRVEHHASFRNIYNKVTAYKFIVKGLLNEANFFSHFRYFYITKYPTSSGRLNTETFFTQLQGYKLAHSLVDFAPQHLLTKETFSQFIAIVKEQVPEIKIHSQIEKSFSIMEDQNRGLYLKQMLSLFKFTDVKDLELYTQNTTIEDKLNWICKNIKKPKEIWLAYNMLDKFINNTYLNSGFQKQDATSSAIQFIGLLENNYSICQKSNIVGITYHDIYSTHSDLLVKDIKIIKTFVSDRIIPLITDFNNRGTAAEKKVYQLITDKTAWESVKNDPNITTLLNMTDNTQIMIYLTDLKFPTVGLGIFNAHKDLALSTISLIREYLEAVNLFETVPENLLNSRNITKKIIMTIGYNAGETAGVDGIYGYLLEGLYALGKQNINTYQVKKLSVLCYQLLHPHITQNLSVLAGFAIKISNFVKYKLKDNTMPIEIKTPYITWTFAKYNISTISRNKIKSYDAKKEIRFAIFEHSGIDQDDTETAFASVFVHSCDAFVVHDVMNNIRKINEKCRAAGLPEIRVVFNHDCFTISAQHAWLLQSLVRVSYNKVHIMRKQIPALENSTKGFPNILCTSPNYLRY